MKGGLGFRNANPPWSAASSVCRFEEGRGQEALCSGTENGYWVGVPIGHVFQHPDAGLEPWEKRLPYEQGWHPLWPYPRLLRTQLDSLSGR